VDATTWRKLTLRAESRWEDGIRDVVQVETLQAPHWVEAQGAKVGARVPLPLDLLEMGLPPDLRAEVVANEPCPSLAPGAGRVVLTTVSHLNSAVRELTVTDDRGQRETFRPTVYHKFYRESDEAWVSAGDLCEGNRLLGRFGSVTVLARREVAGVHRVYNLTVEGEHVYQVSALGVLAHNNNCQNPGKGLASNIPKTPSDAINRYTRWQGGYIDPGTNRWVEKALGDYTQVHSAHIYPASLIEQLPGFDKLTRTQQNWLLNHPDNLIPLPKQWNSSMGNRLADEWAKTRLGSTANKEFIDQLRIGQQAFERMAKEQIATWLGQ
jgi:hypothetical protein